MYYACTCICGCVLVVSVKHMYLQPVIIHANTCRIQVNTPSIPTSVLHYQHYLFCYFMLCTTFQYATLFGKQTVAYDCVCSACSIRIITTNTNTSNNKNVFYTFYIHSIFFEWIIINIHYNISSTIKPPFIQRTLETKQRM